MQLRRWRRRLWGSLGVKLFISYVAIVVAGMVTLLAVSEIVSRTFFEDHFARMMSSTTMQGMMGMIGPGMMGSGPSSPMWSAFDTVVEDTFRTAMREALFIGSGVALVTAVGVSLFVTARVVGPIRRLAIASRRVADGHYAERVTPGTHDELGELAMSFNEMASSLEAAERRRLDLIGDVAHELRTPVTTLEGYLEELLDEQIEPSPELWAKLHGEAGRLRRLIDDLQQLSRAEARQLPMHFETIAPDILVREAVDRLAPQFDDKGLRLLVEAAPDAPSVRADRERAQQVLVNLLTNALRYTTAPGSVTVTLYELDREVKIAVADSGVGISPEQLPHVFERFYRVDKSRSRALGGSGIGLTIAKAVVEAMGGRIWAESAGLGRGARFVFTLPTAR
ncbi:MAG: HAMP domain-containing protein [Chloroflexi bacterium]|nr:HAMP domain-containing protein [Chloroflexota bacterium]